MVVYDVIDQTSDLGFECRGKTLEALFATAILALADLITRIEPLSTNETRVVTASGTDDALRLRAILEETLYLFEKEGFLPKEAEVVFEKDGVVRATLRGQRVDLATYPIDRVVKAVTYHQLSVTKKRGTYRARVILDL